MYDISCCQRVNNEQTIFPSTKNQITSSCSSFIQDPQSITATPYTNNNDNSSLPRPEQAIEYYCASSIILALDGYNNSAALDSNLNDTTTPDTPLPSNINTDYINQCVNNTIGTNAPLIDSSAVGLAWSAPSALGLVGVAWLIYMMLALV